MRESYTLEKVDIQTLYKTMLEKQRAGYRLCQICATAFEGYNEIIYSVVKEYTFENYKIELPIDDEITTISDFYPSAMLYENEMKELFGIKIKSINIDYDNKFYRIKAKTPFKKEVKDAIKIVKTDDTAKEESLDSGKIVNDMSKCILCGLCSRKCPSACITVDRTGEKTWSINRDDCIGCGACIDACLKFKALSFAKDDGEKGIVTLHKEEVAK